MKKRTGVFKLLSLSLSLILLSACGANETAPAQTDEPAPVPDNGVGNGKVEVYQLAPNADALMMSYVIKTANNKIVVIDGGIDGKGMNDAPYLPAAIRAILGKKHNEYFEIEAWFLSHGHYDHYLEAAKMLEKYQESDNCVIRNFYFDFPDFTTEWTVGECAGESFTAPLERFKKGLDRYYETVGFRGIRGAEIPESEWVRPEGAENYYYDLINGAVINEEAVAASLAIEVDGVTFRVLQTWDKRDQTVNSTSVVLRMVCGTHSILFLGDEFSDSAARLLKAYTVEEIASEYVQLGHHGQQGPDESFYKAIGAEDSVRLWPAPKWVFEVYKREPYAYVRSDDTREWFGLPADYKEFEAQGLHKTGRDIIAGLYALFPSEPSISYAWTKAILAEQCVAVFE